MFLEHTNNLIRSQKRNAIRAKCHILANLYILKEKTIDYNRVETANGLKCLLEDISEKGAMIRIGGKGIPNIQIKLQFQIDNKLVIMFGLVKTVEYNAEIKQSRLHFECKHIDPFMKNIVLSYVYNILPEKEKEIYDALALTDSDENSENKLMTDKVYDETEEINAANKNAAESIGDAISNTDNVIELNKVEDDGEDEKQEEAVQ